MNFNNRPGSTMDNSPFLKELLSQPENISQTNPASPVENGSIEEIVAQIQQELADTQQLCDDEMKLLEESAVLGSSASLRAAFGSVVSRRMLRVSGLLYAYGEAAMTDPYILWRMVNKKTEKTSGAVSLKVSDKQVLIYLPYLPKRANRSKEELVNQLLAAKIFASEKRPDWTKWEAVFHHVFPASTRQSARDVDNYDYKNTIDLIAYFVGSSDNALNFSMQMHTYFTDKTASGVYIDVHPKSSVFPDFSSWQ